MEILVVSPELDRNTEELLGYAQDKGVSTDLARYDSPSLPGLSDNHAGSILFDDGSRLSLQTVIRVRKHTRERSSPVIVVASQYNKKEHARFLASGASCVCDPDVSPERLFAELESRKDMLVLPAETAEQKKLQELRRELLQPFIAATIEAVQIMAGLKVKVQRVYRKSENTMKGDISAVIYLISHTERLLAVSFPIKGARKLTQKILAGLIADPPLDIICDSLAELANIIAGQVKGVFVHTNYEFDISTPTVISGHNHEIRHRPDLPCFAIQFEGELGEFELQLCIRARDLAKKKER